MQGYYFKFFNMCKFILDRKGYHFIITNEETGTHVSILMRIKIFYRRFWF